MREEMIDSDRDEIIQKRHDLLIYGRRNVVACQYIKENFKD
jgi:hypothetical protein